MARKKAETVLEEEQIQKTYEEIKQAAQNITSKYPVVPDCLPTVAKKLYKQIIDGGNLTLDDNAGNTYIYVENEEENGILSVQMAILEKGHTQTTVHIVFAATQQI